MERLLKRRNLQQRLNQVEKEISRKKHAPFDIEADEITAQNIVSDSSKHYVLLKKALEKKDISTFKREENVKESIIRDEPEVNFLSEDSNVVAEDLTQEEILAIMKNDSGVEKETQEQNVVHHISSSEDDSDLEEVPTTSQQSEVVLSVPINPDELSSDEDMFADIFGKPGTSVQNSCVTFLNVTSSMDEETSYEAQSSTSVIGHHRPEVFNLSNKEEKFAEAYPLQSESNQQKPDASEEFLPDKLLCSKEADSTGSAEFVEVAKAIKLPKPPTPQESVIPGLSAASVASCESTEKICTAEVHKEPIRKEHIVTPEKDQVEASLAYHDLKTDTQAAERSSMEDVDVQVIDDSVNLVQNKFLSSSVSETQSTRPHEKDSEELFHPPQALDGAYRERLEEMDRILNEEQFMLVQERGRQERMATTLTDQIYAESQV